MCLSSDADKVVSGGEVVQFLDRNFPGMCNVVVYKVPDTGDRETERLRDGETERRRD